MHSIESDDRVVVNERTRIIVHKDKGEDELPISGDFELPDVENSEEHFVPEFRDHVPKLTSGDAIVTIRKGEITDVKILISKQDDGAIIYSMDMNKNDFVRDSVLGSWFSGGFDEVRVFRSIASEISQQDNEFEYDMLEEVDEEKMRSR